MDSLLHFRMRLNINCLIDENFSNYDTNLCPSLSLSLLSLPLPLCTSICVSIQLWLRKFSDLFFNGISGSQKDCDLPKTTVLHGSNTFAQLQSQTNNVSDNASSNNSNTRLHVSSGLCDSHNMHQDQVSRPIVHHPKVYMCRQLFRIMIKTINRNATERASRQHSWMNSRDVSAKLIIQVRRRQLSFDKVSRRDEIECIIEIDAREG